MRQLAILVTLLAPALTAQRETQLPEPSLDSVRALDAARARLPIGAAVPIVDVLPDGTVWAAVDDWKAGFDRDGATFVPFLGSDAPRSWPATFRARAASAGGIALDCKLATPVLDGEQVSFVRGGLREVWNLRGDGIEQTFRFDTLPARGELVVRVGVATELEIRPIDGAGFRFEGPRGSFGYGQAFAIDALGERLAIRTVREGDELVLTVPADFVQRAALPLVIDPVIGGVVSLGSSLRELRSTDIAWEATSGVYVLAWERVFSATDSDVHVQRLDANLALVGAAFAIDISADTWARCAIATLEATGRALVVAEVSADGVSPIRIGGRVFDAAANGIVLAPFDIHAQQGADQIRPDVGGRASMGGPAHFFCVVWESAFAPNDHDIFARLVTSSGTLQTLQYVDTSFDHEEHPVISKSCGRDVASASTHAWSIVYRRHVMGGTAIDLRTANMSWDGVLRIYGGIPSAPLLSGIPFSDGTYDVSPPTDEAQGRAYLLVDQRPTPTPGRFDRGQTAFDRSAAILATSLSQFSGSTSFGSASVACDGARFAVAYDVHLNDGSGDVDAWVRSIRLVGAAFAHDDVAFLAASPTPERAPSIVAAHETPNRFGATWCNQFAASQWRIEVVRYDGVDDQGGFSARFTGCGVNLGIGTNGRPALGESFTIQHLATDGLRGFLVGLPVDIPLPFCPGCRLGSDGMVVLSGPAHTLSVPADPRLVGATLALQGFLFTLPAPGLCLGNLSLGPTIDATIQ